MQIEHDIELAVVQDALRYWGIFADKLEFTGIGMPDQIFWVHGGRPLIIEFKDPKGCVSKWQKLKIARLRHAGYEVQIHDNYHAAMAAIWEANGRRGMAPPAKPSGGRAVPTRTARGGSAGRPRAWED